MKKLLYSIKKINKLRKIETKKKRKSKNKCKQQFCLTIDNQYHRKNKSFILCCQKFGSTIY